MARENEIANIYICAVWLVKSNRLGSDAVKFWSQVLNCKETFLKYLMNEAIKMKRNLSGDQCHDVIMRATWNELKDFNKDECKLLFKRGRSDERN